MNDERQIEYRDVKGSGDEEGHDRGDEPMARIESVYAFGSKPFGHYKETPPVPIENIEGFRVGRDGWKEVFHLFLKNCDHPALQDEIYYQDEQFMVIYDGYPKARYHLLLMAKPSFLDVMRPSDLRREHLPAVRRMHALGRAVAKCLSQQGIIGEIRIGVHAIPSMEPLHMHIISQDFDSDRLRRPRHWNIFTTDIFLEPSWVEEKLERHGCLQLDMDRYIRLNEQTPRCHVCHEKISGVERLKAHYLSHETVSETTSTIFPS
ncbi:unnamed protein product [Ectocarpus fasciculatus]